MSILHTIFYNSDSYISQEEFVNYKNKTVHMASTDSGKQQIVLQFKKIDTDKDGRINWWEFLSHESRLFLAKRPTVSKGTSIGKRFHIRNFINLSLLSITAVF